MGTHNLLLPLGDAVFLEVIAINPTATKPQRPRWFELDRLPSNGKPFLGCWVARTDDIHSSLADAPEHLGVAERMSRGTLEWLISIPKDGSLPLGGTAPALIQWPTDIHPSKSMQNKGCRLMQLELLHPEPQRLKALIGSLRFAKSSIELTVSEATTPGLVAHIDTPLGLRAVGGASPFHRARRQNH